MDLETNTIPVGLSLQAQALPRNTYNLPAVQQVEATQVLPAPPPSVIYQVLPSIHQNRVHPVQVPQAQIYTAPPPSVPAATTASSTSSKSCIIAIVVSVCAVAIAGVVIAVVVTRNNGTSGDSIPGSVCEYPCLYPSTQCVLQSNVCDGKVDCPTGEDELGCDTTVCDGYVCPSGTTYGNGCIYSSWVCDNIVDCVNGEDEQGCGYIPEPIYCTDGTLFCDGVCISDYYVCNGIHECSDGVDEYGCSGICYGYTCPYGVYSQYADYGSTNCISWSSVCDGISQCVGSFDEQDCVTTIPVIPTCTWNSVSCDGTCIPSYQVCDGHPHCSDSSDEVNCVTGCSSNEFHCDAGSSWWYYGYCIPLSWQCDNYQDCWNGQDEQNCDNAVCSTTQFTCVNGGYYGNCITSSWECDGIVDCNGATDESNCTCDSDEFKCATGTSANGLNCISINKQCDGDNDCTDGSDEDGCDETFACQDPTANTPIRISNTKRCDDVEDCLGGIDEDKCIIASDGSAGGNVQIYCVNAGSYYDICSANWLQATGDAACAKLGYGDMINSEIVSSDTTVKGMLVGANGVFSLEMLSQQDPVDCPGNSTIKFQCTNTVSCGLISRSTARVVGGEDTTIGQHPWQVSIQQGAGSTWSHFCGGTIIGDEFVVTSAHCVDEITSAQYQYFRVTAGITNLTQTLSTTNIYSIKKIVHHPLYSYLAWDVALIQVNTSFVWSSNIQQACVPAPGEIFTEGADVSVTGWGATAEGGSIATTLQVATVPLINTETCRTSYTTLAHYLTDDMICAGLPAGGKDTCQGDSGGPLIATRNNRRYVAGLTSWGIGCARPNKPGVYTEVSDVLDWIKREMEKANV